MFKMCSMLAPAAASALLASCGGEGGPYVASVKVAGDSFSSGGAFGAKATVQDANREVTRL